MVNFYSTELGKYVIRKVYNQFLANHTRAPPFTSQRAIAGTIHRLIYI